MRNKIKHVVFLTLLIGLGPAFAYQTIPLKPLPEITNYADKPKEWLPVGLSDSYSNYHKDFDVTSTNSIAPAEESNSLLGIDIADPTMPLVAAPTVVLAPVAQVEKKGLDKSKFKLSQILISSNRKTAIINNKLVKEGEKVDEATVLSIMPNTVILQDANSNKIELSFVDKPIRGISKHMDDAHDEKK